jgi:hypothetical protein
MKKNAVKIGPGTRFLYTLADGNPLWEVIRSRGRGVWEAKVVDDPDWNGTIKVFTTQEITASVSWNTCLTDLYSASEAFYASLKPGQTVHYHDGFGQYVRCIVVRDGSETKLKKVALVGNWKERDLPHRMNSGEVYISYHVKSVLDGELFRPSASNIYEHKVSEPGPDPSTLPAFDLTIPTATPEEAEKARLNHVIQSLYNALNEGDTANPRATLESALQTIQTALTV